MTQGSLIIHGKGLNVKHGQIKLKIGTGTNLGSRNPNMVLVLRIDARLINYSWRDKYSHTRLKMAIETNLGMENPNIEVLTPNSLIMHEGTDMARSA